MIQWIMSFGRSKERPETPVEPILSSPVSQESGRDDHLQMLNKRDRKAFLMMFNRTKLSGERVGKVLESGGEDSGTCSDSERSQGKEEEATSDFSEGEPEPVSLMKFHVNEWTAGKSGEGVAETFAGNRFYPGLDTSTIKCSKGSIRGVRNRVRAGIDTFQHMNDTKTWREREIGQVVVYTTTMGVIRRTHSRCLKTKNIFKNHMVNITEKDVYINQDFQKEIKTRMRTIYVELPQVFIEGMYLGDAEVIEKLNESGELRKILKPYKNPEVCATCTVCGGYRYLPCRVCNGSKKSLRRYQFNSELVALKCMNCNEVGLVQCSAC